MKLLKNFYQVASSNSSHHYDASVYVFNTGEGLLLMDSGTPDGFDSVMKNIRSTGLDPLDVKWIFGTHGHYDHVGNAALWKRETGCELYLHPLDTPQVESADDVKTTAGLLYGRHFPAVTVDKPFRDGQVFVYPNGVITVIHTPGHTPGSVCFKLEMEGLSVLVAGDTLWGGSSEKIGSDEAAWKHSLERLCEEDFDLLTFGHTASALYGDANRRLEEATRQFGVYYNPWFKAMDQTYFY